MTVHNDVETLLQGASNAIAALRSATEGKQVEDPAKTDVSTLLALTKLLDGFASVTARHRQDDALAMASLDRIAELKVRGAAELIEQGNWKKLCAELQSVALQALTAKRANDTSPHGR